MALYHFLQLKKTKMELKIFTSDLAAEWRKKSKIQKGLGGIAESMKPEEWGPLTKINPLTADGLRFVTEIINDRPLEPLSTYFRKHIE